MFWVRPNKKRPVFRVTQAYLILLVKPGFCSGFLKKKNTNLCILKGEMSFKMHEIIFFQKKICEPTLPKIFRPVTRNTLIFETVLLSTHNICFG